MLQPPWNARIYRNRHGRGTRTPMFGTRLPRYRTRTGMFDDMVAAQAPTKLELQLAVRDELVARIAELYGRRPEEIDPDWGL